jgi:hypothetical protein
MIPITSVPFYKEDYATVENPLQENFISYRYESSGAISLDDEKYISGKVISGEERYGYNEEWMTQRGTGDVNKFFHSNLKDTDYHTTSGRGNIHAYQIFNIGENVERWDKTSGIDISFIDEVWTSGVTDETSSNQNWISGWLWPLLATTTKTIERTPPIYTAKVAQTIYDTGSHNAPGAPEYVKPHKDNIFKISGFIKQKLFVDKADLEVSGTVYANYAGHEPFDSPLGVPITSYYVGMRTVNMTYHYVQGTTNYTAPAEDKQIAVYVNEGIATINQATGQYSQPLNDNSLGAPTGYPAGGWWTGIATGTLLPSQMVLGQLPKYLQTPIIYLSQDGEIIVIPPTQSGKIDLIWNQGDYEVDHVVTLDTTSNRKAEFKLKAVFSSLPENTWFGVRTLRFVSIISAKIDPISNKKIGTAYIPENKITTLLNASFDSFKYS